MNQVLPASTFLYVSNPLQLNFHEGFPQREEKSCLCTELLILAKIQSDKKVGKHGGWKGGGHMCENICQNTYRGTLKVTSYAWPDAEQDREEHCGQHFPGTRMTVSSLHTKKE